MDWENHFVEYSAEGLLHQWLLKLLGKLANSRREVGGKQNKA